MNCTGCHTNLEFATFLMGARAVTQRDAGRAMNQSAWLSNRLSRYLASLRVFAYFARNGFAQSTLRLAKHAKKPQTSAASLATARACSSFAVNECFNYLPFELPSRERRVSAL